MQLTTFSDLRVIIGEDEQMLAIDMAQQLEALGARVVETVSTIQQLEQTIASGLDGANAAVLDVELADGEVYPLVTRLEESGVAVVFCTGFHPQDRPADFSHIAWVSKPARAIDLATSLCLALDTRKAPQID